jgi:hypothetical protein
MQRMKTFAIYALCVILFFIFSNVMINVALKAQYNPIDTYKTEPENIGIDIKEARATYVNGYVGGQLINRGDAISKTYIKIDLYTERDVYLGTKYIEIDNLEQNETRDFRIGFKYTNADYAKVSLVNEVSKDEPEQSFISENIKGIYLLTTILLVCYVW